MKTWESFPGKDLHNSFPVYIDFERTEGIGNFPVNNTGKFPIWRIWNKERIVKFPIVIQWETLQNERYR